MLDERDLTLAILAGGAGLRMGHPKGLLIINGRPIVQHLVERFSWTGPTMLVTAPGIPTPLAAERVNHLVCDPLVGIGPLRGVLTAIEHATTEMVVVVTVDMPGVHREQLAWISRQLNEQPRVLGLMTSRRSKDGNQVEPFPSAYRRAAGAVVAQQLALQRRALHALLGCAGFSAIDAPLSWPKAAWENLNTREDLQRFESRES